LERGLTASCIQLARLQNRSIANQEKALHNSVMAFADSHARAVRMMAQPMKAACQSMGIGVSIGSRCNVASTFVAEADTTGVHGLPMTKPKYLEHPFRSSQFGSPSKRSRMHCPAYRPPHSKREMTLGWSCAPFGYAAAEQLRANAFG
jgi:hypothetical protein